MSKTFGLDLGQNSIGWAIIDDGKILGFGTRIYHSKNLQLRKRSTPKLNSDKFIRLPLTHKLAIILISVLTALSIINISNWQFWLGLNIAAILTYLTMKK